LAIRHNNLDIESIIDYLSVTKALVLENPRDLQLRDVPEPELGSNDVLVQVKACGICGSDVHGYDGSTGRRIPPIVMGHEAAGIVIRVGHEVSTVGVGNRVTFRELKPLLAICRETIVWIGKTESALIRSLRRDPLLHARVERLMTIPSVGPITALTWVLEVDDVARFHSVKQAVSSCGLCGAERSSAETIKRMPISKQRNKHLQSVLIEAAKLAPRLSPELALVYDTEKQKGHANRASIAVARKLVAYLLAVDRSGREFVVAGERRAAA
jgi:hypothetical protein